MGTQLVERGGVTSPGGFRAAGVACGLKESGGPDLALVVSDRPCSAAAVFTTECDQMRRGAEWFARQSDHASFLMHVPTTWQTPDVRALYVDELKRLGRFLASLGGCEPDDDRLAEIILEYDQARQVLRERCRTLPARAAAEAMAEFHRSGAAAAGDTAAASAAGVPLALVGGPMLRKSLDLLDRIEQAGGRIVLDATVSGEMTLPRSADRERAEREPLAELADMYFGSIPHAFRRPNTRWTQWIERELAERGVRGVLFLRHLWCDTWHAELGRMKEWASLPVLDMDVSDDGNTLGRLTMRVESFLEGVR